MIFRKWNGKPMPDFFGEKGPEAAANRLNRREFLAVATSYGATAATAWAMMGLPRPARAETVTPQRGGTVRIQQQLAALKDPRTFDFNQLATFTRGWLEYLVRYNSDGSFSPYLLSGWEINDDATLYTLSVRDGVRWNNGDAFTAADVARNIERFCDTTVEGNSMHSRLGALVDADSGQARAGAIEVVDDLTVRLHLSRPDISLIASFSDYPAAIVPESFSADTMLTNPVGTGPYLPQSYEVGVHATLVRNDDHEWWNAGNGAWMERIDLIDLGADPVSYVSAAEADEIDATYDTAGDYIEMFDQLPGWQRNEVVTAATVLARTNQLAQDRDGTLPYADVRVRRALQMAVDNEAVLEFAVAGFGTTAENHHVAPVHPEYAELPPQAHDPEGALALLEAAGMAEYEHDLISLEAGFWASTADAIAAQLRAAGIPVRRTVYPGSTFWNNWANYPFSITNWNHRPLGISTLAIAYTSGASWNETGFASDRFDALVNEALSLADPDARREVTAQLQRIMQEEGVIIQPFWRGLYNHTRDGLEGADIHIQQELWPADFYWAA